MSFLNLSKQNFPIIKNFRETSIIRAFIMSAILFAFVSATTSEVRNYLDNEDAIFLGVKAKNLSRINKFWISLLVSFFVGILFYLFYHIIFAYGGGMIAEERCNKKGLCNYPPGSLFVGKSWWKQLQESFEILKMKYSYKSLIKVRVDAYKKLLKKHIL